MKPLMLLIITLFTVLPAAAQDTLQISLEEFIRTGVENSGELDMQRQNVRLASNRIGEAKANRWLPEFQLNTQHGVVPGIKSDREDLTEGQYYLDPELENDWEDWGLFTRAEVSAVQPIFTWGGLRNLVRAAESAADAAREEFEARESEIELRLYELYMSYMMSREMNRLLEEAQESIDRIERQIEEGDGEAADMDESEVFKFRVFKSEFGIRAAEVQENVAYIRRIWDYVLQAEPGEVYVPDSRFMGTVANELEDPEFYRTRGVGNRAEIQAVEAGIEAAEYGLKATRAQSYPSLFLGLSGSYANTPNRPRQDNPFIINTANYATGAVGVGIRQNLDLFSLKTQVRQRQIQYDQARYLKDAATDGIVLEVNEKYRNASLTRTKVRRLDEALQTSKEWLRQEQLDYDFGIGDTQDLLEAMQKELELRVQQQQQIFEHNKAMAELFKAAGVPVTELRMNDQ